MGEIYSEYRKDVSVLPFVLRVKKDEKVPTYFSNLIANDFTEILSSYLGINAQALAYDPVMEKIEGSDCYKMSLKLHISKEDKEFYDEYTSRYLDESTHEWFRETSEAVLSSVLGSHFVSIKRVVGETKADEEKGDSQKTQ